LNVAGPEADQLYANQALVPLGQNPSLDEGGSAGAAGVDGDQGAVTHVPALNGAGGTNVPASVVQHVRAMSGLMGRERTLQQAAREQIEKTGDADGVREACEYLLERRI